MTREEALKILKYRSGWNLSIRDVNALEMAIKALEQEPCKDTISREDAIGAVANLFEMSEYPHPYPQGKPIRLRDIKEKLKQLPPVQPKPKTGQWVLLNECSNSGYYCSECHKKVVKEGWSGTVKKIKFCPNCGCRMVKPQESEDKE
jgi:DNA-directed RNA polymerase subunit RPC12/RpoP